MLTDGRIDFDDLSTHASESAAVEETGLTFRANAMLKASGYTHRFGVWALADDSGLEVDALKGAPGVHSARFAEMHGAGSGDTDNNALLIRKLRAIAGAVDVWPVFTARFVCVLALSDPTGRVVLTTRGSVEGRIVPEPRGLGGFGYDPHFLVEQIGQTTAELSAEQKHAISHRGVALRRMRELMATHLPVDRA
jgi:XTP/dITP diphosphohydrolase